MITESEIEQINSVGKLKKLLNFPYSHHIRNAASNKLDKIGWKPKGIEDKAAKEIATGNIKICPTLGNDAIWPLVNILKDVDPEIRYSAAQAISQIKEDRVKDYIKNFIFDKDERVRIYIAKTLSDFNWAPTTANESVVFYHCLGNEIKTKESCEQAKIENLESFIDELNSQPEKDYEFAWEEEKRKSLNTAKKTMIIIGIVGLTVIFGTMFGIDKVFDILEILLDI